MKRSLIAWILALSFLTTGVAWSRRPKPPKRTPARPAKARPAPAKTASAPTTRPARRPAARKAKTKKPSTVAVLKGYMKLMSGELKRHWKWMQKRKKPRPFYMAYLLQHARQVSVSAQDGAIFRVTNPKIAPTNRIQVRIRVGDHKLDNTGRDGYDYRAFRHMLSASSYLVAKPTPDFFRKRLWKLTDRRFKESMASYHRKRYVLSLKADKKDKSDSFSKEKAVRLIQTPPNLSFDFKKWKAIAREVSAFSRKDLRITRASVVISASQDAQILIDTHGTRVIKHKTLYMYTVYVTYLSPNKEYLSNVRLSYYDKESKLPNAAQLKKVVQKTLQELINQGNAQEGKPSEAPAILLPDVAGVLFHEALGHRLEAQRMLRESDGRTFRRKIGAKVIPTFLSVYDDPTLEFWGKIPLNGHYLVDDQGIRSQRVTLLKDGVLRGFLMSRKPIDKFKHSNGHGRAKFGRNPFSRMGNLLVKSSKEYPFATLRQMLIKEARRQGKAHGYIMSRASGGYTHTGTYGIQSFKNRPIVVWRVDAKTGKQTLVKGLEMIGTPLTVVNNILATGNDYGVFNGFCGAESGYVPVSAIAPSVLLKTVEMQRVKITKKKGYLLKPPFAPKGHGKKPSPARRAPARRAVSKLAAPATDRKAAPTRRAPANKAPARRAVNKRAAPASRPAKKRSGLPSGIQTVLAKRGAPVHLYLHPGQLLRKKHFPSKAWVAQSIPKRKTRSWYVRLKPGAGATLGRFAAVRTIVAVRNRPGGTQARARLSLQLWLRRGNQEQLLMSTLLLAKGQRYKVYDLKNRELSFDNDGQKVIREGDILVFRVKHRMGGQAAVGLGGSIGALGSFLHISPRRIGANKLTKPSTPPRRSNFKPHCVKIYKHMVKLMKRAAAQRPRMRRYVSWMSSPRGRHLTLTRCSRSPRRPDPKMLACILRSQSLMAMRLCHMRRRRRRPQAPPHKPHPRP